MKYYNKIEKCVALNFESNQRIEGLPMYIMEIDSDFNSERMVNLHESETADNCFLIFIGGKYAQVLDQVMEKVETISKKIGLYPLGLFITMENRDHFPKFISFDDGTHFPLVHRH